MLKETIEQIAEANPEILYTSKAIKGVTIIWRGGEINSSNLPEQLLKYDLVFVPKIHDTKFRMEDYGLEYFRESRDRWVHCENGDHQVYFDFVKAIQNSVDPASKR